MSVPSEPAQSTAWPPARPTGISPIQHPAWEAARNAILDLAAEGPVTAIIIGEPGTGKTWLLRELAGALGDHGFLTMMLMQGNLPMTLSSGAALLVDEASLMDEPTRATLYAQRHGVAILAGAEWFEDELDPAAPSPVIIRLRPLDPAEIADFAAEWLGRAGLAIPHPATLSALTADTGGRVGAIVRRLGTPATTWPQPPIEQSDELPAEAHEPRDQPLRAKPRRPRSLHRPLLAGSAIAAAIAIFWFLISAPVPHPTNEAAIKPLPASPSPEPPRPAQTIAAAAVAPALPPLHAADIPEPALITSVAPAQSATATPLLTAQPPPQPDAVQTPMATEIATSTPAIAAAATPPVLAPAGSSLLPPADPAIVATLESPAPAIYPASPSQPERIGGPGLVLVAQPGDTLEKLYDSVYRDRQAPPFATVLAANPGGFKAGAIVVFPEPPGGWQRVQR